MASGAPLGPALAVMRLTLGAFFLIWAFEKILKPELSRRVFESFYFSNPSDAVLIVLGILQLLIVLAFIAGLAKFWTYGALLLMHAVSTLSTVPRLLDPYTPPNHLFWAAVPVLGMLIALFMLRDSDRLLTVRR